MFLLWIPPLEMKTRVELKTAVARNYHNSERNTTVAYRGRFLDKQTSIPVIRSLNLKNLYPYQREGCEWLRTRVKGSKVDAKILADEPGLGKTAQSLRALIPPGIVLCPASLIYVWRDEIEKWRPDLEAVVIESADELPVPHGNQVLLLSHDSLDQPLKEDRLIERNLKHATLIIDEGHRAKNEAAERTIRMRALARQCGKVRVLTGTPMYGNPRDLQGVLETALVFDECFASVEEYDRMFGYSPGEVPPWPPVPPEAEEIKKRIAPFLLQRKKADVLPDLPPKTIEIVPCPVPSNLLRRLQMIDEKWSFLDAREMPGFSEIAAVRHELTKSRIPMLIDYVDECERRGETSLLVFADHLEPLLTLSHRKGWEAMTGSTPKDERERLVKRFQAGKLKGLALSIKVGGVGLTLTKANHGIFASLSYTPDENSQCADRMARIGQKARNVRLTYLVSDHPLERRLLHIHAIKTERNDSIFGG